MFESVALAAAEVEEECENEDCDEDGAAVGCVSTQSRILVAEAEEDSRN